MVETLGYIVFKRETKLSNTSLLASRHIKREKASLPVDVRASKTSLLKVPNIVFESRRVARTYVGVLDWLVSYAVCD